MLRRGGGDEGPEKEVTEMTSWGPVSRFLLRDSDGKERKKGVFFLRATGRLAG